MAKSGFGLDPKKNDNAKKIAGAQSIFKDEFFKPTLSEKWIFLNRPETLYDAWKSVKKQ